MKDENPDVAALVADIEDEDENVRTRAWLRAGRVGAPAIRAVAALLSDPEREVARAAKRALWRIARHAYRPGAEAERRAVVRELIALLHPRHSTALRREVLWMLSEIGRDESVDPVARLLEDRELREDARMALDRIPGERSLAALKAALAGAPDDFKPSIAQGLRHRGIRVPGLPCRKLVPTKKTYVVPER